MSRARAVDDSAAMMRRLERDLHDGAQIRLATLAMNLGMATGEARRRRRRRPTSRRPASWSTPPTAAPRTRSAELRDLVRGIHPPVLDNGLATPWRRSPPSSAIPVALDVELPDRPAPAIETIAYFCAAELLANAAKHSRATRIGLGVAGAGERLLLSVTDDGIGGADPDGAPACPGWRSRVAVVDGRLHVRSPPGGPTRITSSCPRTCERRRRHAGGDRRGRRDDPRQGWSG